MDLANLELWSPPDLHVSYHSIEGESRHSRQVIAIRFLGDYPRGSLGNGHANWISQKTIEAYLAFDPICVVLDFRAMTYTWGNTLLKVFEDWNEMAGNNPPIRLVISDVCESAIRGLVGDSMNELIHESLDEAFEAAQLDAQEWLKPDSK